MRHDHSIKNAYWLPISAPFYWITATYRPLLCLFTAMYAPLDFHLHFYTISTATSGPIVWLTCRMYAGEMEMGGGLFSLVLQCIHNHIRVMLWRTLYLLTCLTFGVDHIQFYPHNIICAIIVGPSSPSFSSNVCFQSCQLSVHIFSYPPGYYQSFFFFDPILWALKLEYYTQGHF